MYNTMNLKKLTTFLIMLFIVMNCANNLQAGELDEITELSSLYDSWVNIKHIEKYGDYAYLVERSQSELRIIVVDLNNLESQPEEINKFPLYGGIFFRVHGNVLYSSSSSTLYIYSLVDPTAPELINSTAIEVRGGIRDAHIAEEHGRLYFYSNAYVGDPQDPWEAYEYKISAYDISDPENPSYACDRLGYEEDIDGRQFFSDEEYLYCIYYTASIDGPSFRLEIWDPTDLVRNNYSEFQGYLPFSLRFYSHFIYENYLYVPTNTKLFAFDMSDIENSTWVESEISLFKFNMMYNGQLYSFGDEQLMIVDISNFPETTVISTQDFPEITSEIICLDSENNIFAALANIDYSGDDTITGAVIFTLSNDGSCDLNYTLTKNGFEFLSSCVFEEYLFLLDSTDSLRVVNIADPVNPYQTNVIAVPHFYGSQTMIANEDIVVAKVGNALYVMERQTEDQIEYTATIEDDDFTFYGTAEMRLNNNSLFIASARSEEFWAYSFNLDNPRSPQLLDSLSMEFIDRINVVQIDDNFVANVVCRNNLIYRFDSSQPGNIEELDPLYFDFPYWYSITDIDIVGSTVNYTYRIPDSGTNGVVINGNYYNSYSSSTLKRQGNEYYVSHFAGLDIYQIQSSNQVHHIENFSMYDIIHNGIHPHGNVIVVVTPRSAKIFQSDLLLDTPEIESIPQEFEIISLYPNPFNASISASFNLPRSGDVAISVYNMLGQQVMSNKQHYQAGNNSWHWNGKSNSGINLASGIYFLNIATEAQMHSRKIIMLK